MALFMDSFCKLPLILLLFFIVITFISPSTPQPLPQPQSCDSYKFPLTSNFSACNDLPVLDSSIHWNYYSSSNSVDIAFKKNNVNDDEWIAWAINPTSRGMVGSQAFVAFKKSDGTMAAYTSAITTYGTELEEGRLSFEVHEVSATFEHGTMILYATFRLPGNSTLVNHVWQYGSVSDDTPLSHALFGPNLKSSGQIDFLTAEVSHYHGNSDNQKILIRKVHGILNGIGWGILMPIGAMMGRYLKAFEASGSAWFHVHRACQTGAYFIGMAGVGLGIYMGVNRSPVHGYIGIAIFVSCTAQVLVAVLLRPGKDHKNRIFWNIFHYMNGYGVIVVAIFNMFRGFSISNSYQKWRNAYLGIIVSLGCVALILEAITWFLLCKNRMKKKMQNSDKNISQHSQENQEKTQDLEVP